MKDPTYAMMTRTIDTYIYQIPLCLEDPEALESLVNIDRNLVLPHIIECLYKLDEIHPL
jgi:hypothetical protein